MQFAPVTVKDSLDVDNTFVPRDIVGNVATYVKHGAAPIGDQRITVKVDRTATGRVKVTYKFALPVIQDMTVAGVTRPTLVRTAFADVTYAFDQTSSEAERANLVYMLSNFLKSGVGGDTAVLLNTIY
jgi:hypothetical protein